MINILFIGDIVGEAGRQVVKENLAALRDEFDLDLVIANGENAAHGKGISERVYNSLLDYGIDVITMGNHTFSKDAIYRFIDDADNLVRPLNMEPLNIGKTYKIVDIKGLTLCVYNVLGNVFMSGTATSVFEATNELLKETKADLYFCDFHGEVTSEKIIYAYLYQNKLQAVMGTHTHVQTADERLIGNLAFISDAGMCGVYESVLGRDIEETIAKVVYQEDTRFTIAKGPAIFCGVITKIDEKAKKAVDIKRIQIRPYVFGV